MIDEKRICPGCGVVMVQRENEPNGKFADRIYCSPKCSHRSLRGQKKRNRIYGKHKVTSIKDEPERAPADPGEPAPIVLPLVSILMDGEPKRYEMRRWKDDEHEGVSRNRT